MTRTITRETDAPVTTMQTTPIEPLDIVAIERRARELRAQALASALRSAVRFVLRRNADTRTRTTGQTA